MNRKAKATATLILILITIGTFILFKPQTKNQKAYAWTGTIYIRSGGEVDPLNAPIERNGEIYTLTDNIFSDFRGIVIEKDNITLDGAGFTVQGTEAYASFGIYLLKRKNVTVKNINVKGYTYGIRIEQTNYTEISQNLIENNHVGLGIFFSTSTNNIIKNNIFKNNTYGIWFRGSTANILRSNTMEDNTHHITIQPGALQCYINDIDSTNTVDGKPVYYLINEHNLAVPPNGGYVALINCTNITVKDFNLSKDGQEILLAYTKNSSIIQNKILAKNGYGIYLIESTGNKILQNEVVNSKYAIGFLHSSNNIIEENTIKNNSIGIELLESSNNTFLHNNFINNTLQIYDYAWDNEYNPSSNIWNSDYPSGGNYWSDHKKPDAFTGPYQNISGNDGITDLPRVIDKNNKDRYPLAGTHCSFIANSHEVQIISNSTICNFEFNGTAITFHVSGKNGTLGFCRVCIPKTLMNATYKVFVNDTEVPYTLLPHSPNTHNCIYFTYQHSIQTVKIIPENTTQNTIILLLTAAFLIISIYHIKTKNLNSAKQPKINAPAGVPEPGLNRQKRAPDKA